MEGLSAVSFFFKAVLSGSEKEESRMPCNFIPRVVLLNQNILSEKMNSYFFLVGLPDEKICNF